MRKKSPVWIAALMVKLRQWSSSVQSQMGQRGSNVLVVIVSSSVTHKIIKNFSLSIIILTNMILNRNSTTKGKLYLSTLQLSKDNR
jgi:hypothetical protein